MAGNWPNRSHYYMLDKLVPEQRKGIMKGHVGKCVDFPDAGGMVKAVPIIGVRTGVSKRGDYFYLVMHKGSETLLDPYSIEKGPYACNEGVGVAVAENEEEKNEDEWEGYGARPAAGPGGPGGPANNNNERERAEAEAREWNDEENDPEELRAQLAAMRQNIGKCIDYNKSVLQGRQYINIVVKGGVIIDIDEYFTEGKDYDHKKYMYVVMDQQKKYGVYLQNIVREPYDCNEGALGAGAGQGGSRKSKKQTRRKRTPMKRRRKQSRRRRTN